MSLNTESKPFLKAEWRKLALANYAVDKKLLLPFLPFKTEIDLWQDSCYVSLVGFMFLNTTVKGFKIPFHANFEEVNLRFYVRYKENGLWKRGVVFILEIVPKPALSFIANTVYKEHYKTMSMRHSWENSTDTLTVEYQWRKKRWNSFLINAENVPYAIAASSEEAFITEHYWGYTKINTNQTSEYEVIHPPWEVYKTKHYTIDVDFGEVYGSAFGNLNNTTPTSVFLAEGSEIKVMQGRQI